MAYRDMMCRNMKEGAHNVHRNVRRNE